MQQIGPKAQNASNQPLNDNVQEIPAQWNSAYQDRLVQQTLFDFQPPTNYQTAPFSFNRQPPGYHGPPSYLGSNGPIPPSFQEPHQHNRPFHNPEHSNTPSPARQSLPHTSTDSDQPPPLFQQHYLHSNRLMQTPPGPWSEQSMQFRSNGGLIPGSWPRPDASLRQRFLNRTREPPSPNDRHHRSDTETVRRAPDPQSSGDGRRVASSPLHHSSSG